jgi:hypothetical protein
MEMRIMEVFTVSRTEREVSSMVSIVAGDLVRSGGVDFHVKHSEDGVIQVWCSDTGETISESFTAFVERCRQRGNIIIKPGEGKFDNAVDPDTRERYMEAA